MNSQCQTCNRSFQNKTGLDQHMQHANVHRSPPQTLPRARILATLNSGISKWDQQAYMQRLTLNAIASSSQEISLVENVTSQDNDKRWSVVPEFQYPFVLEALSQHRHSTEELLGNKYDVNPKFAQDNTRVENRKCQRCGKLEMNRELGICTFHTRKRGAKNIGRPYLCCGTTSKGCKTLTTHDFRHSKSTIKRLSFVPTPVFSTQKPAFRAVTLDCEMVGVEGGASEVVFICAADYVTGAILLQKHVFPAEKVIDWRTQIHGITKSAVEGAVSTGQALAGWQEAREELWKHIDDTSILVGHALNHDLDALRIVHPRIVDSAILARNAVGYGNRLWGLQTLCSQLLNLEIRNNKNKVHACLEDVLATREVVLFCTLKKEELRIWAKVKKDEVILRQEKMKRNRQIKNAKGKENARQQKFSRPDVDDEDETMRWSDIAEDCGWPHPDTGYDPWSD